MRLAASPPSLRRRLWFAAGALTLFLATLAVANAFLPPDRAARWNMVGYDFRPFYAAGAFAREGRPGDLYDLDAVAQFESGLAREHGLDIDQGLGPIFNPPFFAWMFAPLARWPYPTALKLWYGVSLACFAGAVVLMGRFAPSPHGTPGARGRTGGPADLALIALLMLTSLPAIQALVHAQNTFVSLLLLTVVVTLWRNAKPLAAGLCAGLLFYKPQLGAILAIVLIASAGRRALVGLAITGVLLFLINVLTLPGSLTAFLTRMPANLRWLQESHAYAWHRHATFAGFWRTLLQGETPAPATTLVRIVSASCLTLTALAVAHLIWRARQLHHPAAADLVITATVVNMPLLVPFYFDYDLLLLSVAAVLTATDMMRATTQFPSKAHGTCAVASTADHRLLLAWVFFALSMYFNGPIAHLTRVPAIVPALCTVSLLTLSRARRRLREIESSNEASPERDDTMSCRCAA